MCSRKINRSNRHYKRRESRSDGNHYQTMSAINSHTINPLLLQAPWTPPPINHIRNYIQGNINPDVYQGVLRSPSPQQVPDSPLFWEHSPAPFPSQSPTPPPDYRPRITLAVTTRHHLFHRICNQVSTALLGHGAGWNHQLPAGEFQNDIINSLDNLEHSKNKHRQAQIFHFYKMGQRIDQEFRDRIRGNPHSCTYGYVRRDLRNETKPYLSKRDRTLAIRLYEIFQHNSSAIWELEEITVGDFRKLSKLEHIQLLVDLAQIM